ncbi:nucleotide sugar dehydrogenase [Desulfovibrio sp. OttesenSCG-928-M16]|nr:nucleotide sugar dehydrogenase [Desulfovibrio sp. OttesenSCG-928-M16]
MSSLYPLYEDFLSGKESIAVVGLGYVGLPLAVALARHFTVLGLDLASERINELQKGFDRTGEVEKSVLAASALRCTSDAAELASCRLIIVAVPTPIDAYRKPDLGPLRGASASVGAHLSKGSVVVYESTVYPGVTEEVCAPILEQASGLELGRDFALGYSPERINPGDKVHTVERIVKVVAGSDSHSLELLARVYGRIVEAGVHRAPSIKVAEAAKVIENTQRDLNIALMNELSLIFDRLGIDTLDVLEAAGTKWNFLPFKPGLVGGHCIGVDPYYLTFKAEEAGYHPEVILAGRRINDGMGTHVARKTVKLITASGRGSAGARVGLFGLTFKENVPDLRNSRVPDIKAELEEYGACVLVHDPLADKEEARREYGIDLSPLEAMTGLDAAIFAVAHDAYKTLDPKELAERFTNPSQGVLVDLKGLFEPQTARLAVGSFWRL